MRFDFVPEKGYCVYLIQNLINGKQYVGMSVDVRRRMQGHFTAANRGKPGAIAAAIRKHGFDNFSVSLLYKCATRDEALAREIEEIAVRGSQRNGYNITSGGDGIRGLSDETKEQLRASLSKALRGKPHSDAHNKAVSDALTGMRKSDQHCLNLSKAKKGIKASPEARAKMSASRKGRKLSHEHAMKIRMANTGRRMNEEQRARISESAIRNRGRGVICVENGKNFETLLSARAWLVAQGFHKACPAAIGRACRGLVPRAYGYNWKYTEA